MRNNFQYNFLTAVISVVETTLTSCKNHHNYVLVWYEIQYHAKTVLLKWKQYHYLNIGPDFQHKVS